MKKKLKEICNGYTKNIAQKELDDLNGDYEIFGASGLIKKIDYYISEVPYIGIVKDGSGVGRVNSYPAKSSLIGTMQYIVPNKDIDLQFLMYGLRSLNLGNLYRGAAIPHIYFKEYKEFELNVPPKEEQQKIAAELDTIQSAIDNKKQQLSLLDEAVKSKFVEMFGENPVESGKWKVDNLSSVCSISGGYAFKSCDFKDNGIPILRIGNINAGFFRPVNMVYWNESTNLERYAVYPGDLVMSLTGTAGKEDYGNICILDNEYPKYYLNQRNAMFTKLKSLNKLYLAFLLKLPNMKSRLTSLNHGVRQGNILNKDLETLPIPIPPIDLQNQFASFVQQIDKSKSLVKQQIADLQELMDSKMQEYFGE